MFNKRGMSELISTVLIILVTLTAVAILATALMSFVNNSLEKSKTDCLTSIDKIKIVLDGSCYDSTSPINTTIKIRFSNINATKLYFVLEVPEGTSVFERTLTEETKVGMVKQFDFSDINSTKVDVGIIINNKRCSISDSAELKECES